MNGQGSIPPIGAVLAGKYQVERVLGQGGMGVVVKAQHLQLHQPVAMKFLLPEVLGNQQIVQRFLREAQAAVRLRSEHVARVIDVGTLESGAPYMVLEYLEGSDLSMFPRSQLSVGGIVDLILQACEALAEAHSLGIVHRDIKPANFFITRGTDSTPLLKVLDFGISKTASNTNLTATQSVMGTPAYMSPEQMRSSRDVDLRSDIWSLGVVLYELLQGAPPFGGDTFSSMVIKVVTEGLPRMTVQLPGELEMIVYRCLEKDPARRFQNVAELTQMLAPYAQSQTQAAISIQRTRSIVGLENHRGPQDPGPARRAIPPSTLSGAVGAHTTTGGGRRWPIFAGLAVLLAIVAVAVIASNSGGGGAGDKKAEGTGVAHPQTPPPPPSAPAAAPTAAAQTTAPAVATPVTTPPVPAPAVPNAVATSPTARPPAAPPPATPPPASTTPTAPTAATTDATASAAQTAAAKPAAGTPDAAAKKPKKPIKAGSAGKPDSGSAKPPSDDDILGTRN